MGLYWNGKRVLVTGASGLLGGWLVKRLLGDGAEIVALVRDHAPNSILIREGLSNQIKTVAGDLESLSTLQRTIAEYQPHTIFHLAAQTLVQVSKQDPVGTLRSNIMGTWNLLEAARITSRPNIVIASSDKAYGASDTLPYRETHPLQGKFPYDVSKACADLIAQMYAATYESNVIIARCANLFGGGDSNSSRLIPGIIADTIAGKRFVIRSNGNQVRDYLYVKDAVQSYLLLGEQLGQDGSFSGEAFNFGLELRLTVQQVVNMVLKIMNRLDLDPCIHNTASHEIQQQYLDTSKARDRLGWTAHYGMEEGLRETIAWYSEYLSA